VIAPGVTGAGGLTTIEISLLVADAGLTQVAFEVNTTVTLSPFTRDVELNVEEFEPILEPFSFHWYEGVVPPLVGVAVKVTDVPGQIVVDDAAIETDGTRTGFTTIDIPVLVAVVGFTQTALDVRITVTMSALFKVVELNVGLLVPTLEPFTCHW
jgi:hypothetical protein